ncbi:hypothetical protein [Paraferrimonas haliotis]|uniref:Uncharacterized protein n=1 Tax=Paraferrimonas haliotis TaxID=2013866 RepID=A0AA37WWA3_9GAMM|nr:hypothetical protein [Paraferrimonas haliotis]GLS83222.1 hypothetical protein GCM10007894_11990 [Paraferrimonas haliotis]
MIDVELKKELEPLGLPVFYWPAPPSVNDCIVFNQMDLTESDVGLAKLTHHRVKFRVQIYHRRILDAKAIGELLVALLDKRNSTVGDMPVDYVSFAGYFENYLTESREYQLSYDFIITLRGKLYGK